MGGRGIGREEEGIEKGIGGFLELDHRFHRFWDNNFTDLLQGYCRGTGGVLQGYWRGTAGVLEGRRFLVTPISTD